MAVYGRKVSRLNGSLSMLSTKDLEHNCEPCSVIDQHVKACGFCEDCQEYLCQSCFSYHQRAKVSKHHQLLELDSMGNHSVSTVQAEVCNEICSEHSHNIIEFFCPAHGALGCSVCIVLNHRSCDIDYIPDACTDIGESEEYKQLMRKLTLELDDIDDIKQQATDTEQYIEYFYDRMTKEIVEFRKEIDNHFDKLQHKLQTEADKIKTANKVIAGEVIQNCESISSDVSQIQSRLERNKSSKQNIQLYIEIKKAKTKLRTNEVQKVVDHLEGTDRQYIFERSKDIVNMLANADVFGQIRLSTRLAFPRIKQTHENSIDKEENLFHKEDINVRIRSDIHCCNIAGCAALTSSKLLLADYNNEKLKIVDTVRKTVLKEKTLDSAPFDLAVLPENQIAVSLPMKREILIIAADMSNVRRFSVKGRCRGLLNHQDNLFVVCKDPSNVDIFDLLGNLTRTISLPDEIFQEPFYIVYNEVSRLIFLSTGRIKNDAIVGITLQGEISVVYKQKDVVYPSGMLMLDDGSLLTCCFSNSGTIHHISKDLKQSHSKYSYIQFPHCICYSLSRDRIYIGCGTDQLKVFCLE